LRSVLAGAPTIAEFLSDESRAHFEQVKSLLDEASVSYEVRAELVRGLDYYTDTVFEVQSEGLGAQNALCGGGRYDWLIKELGGSDTPSVGVAMGIERAIMVMTEQGVVTPPPASPVFIVAATESARAEVSRLARELRASGVAVLTDVDGKGLKQQMKMADRAGSRTAIIVGDDELASGTVTVKDLSQGTQRSVDRSRLSMELVS
jgi:histidyl-tRNA synthetase